MWRKLSMGLIVIAIPAIASKLPADEPSEEKSLSQRAYISNQFGSTLALLQIELVQKEIALTDDQKAKLVPLDNEFSELFHKIFRDNSGISQKTQDKKTAPANGEEDSNKSADKKETNIASLKEAERQKKLSYELNENDRKFQKKLGEILHRDQIDRLGEIILQSLSCIQPGHDLIGENSTEFNEALLKFLEISRSQESKIRRIGDDASRASVALYKDLSEDLESANLTESQLREELHKRSQTFRSIIDRANKKVVAILTPIQCAAISKAKGKEIDFVKLLEQAIEMELVDELRAAQNMKDSRT